MKIIKSYFTACKYEASNTYSNFCPLLQDKFLSVFYFLSTVLVKIILKLFFAKTDMNKNRHLVDHNVGAEAGTEASDAAVAFRIELRLLEVGLVHRAV
jgi:hypothetical protein